VAIEQVKIKRRKSAADEAEMDITPMIDITFLLLIFFLVSSKMTTPGDVSLPKARHGVGIGADNAVILTIDATGKVYKGDNKDAANLVQGDDEAQAEEIAAYVDDVMLGQSKDHVLIKAAKDVKHRVVSRVAKAVGKSEVAETLNVAVLDE